MSIQRFVACDVMKNSLSKLGIRPGTRKRFALHPNCGGRGGPGGRRSPGRKSYHFLNLLDGVPWLGHPAEVPSRVPTLVPLGKQSLCRGAIGPSYISIPSILVSETQTTFGFFGLILYHMCTLPTIRMGGRNGMCQLLDLSIPNGRFVLCEKMGG
jgi:hypothetical protein